MGYPPPGPDRRIERGWGPPLPGAPRAWTRAGFQWAHAEGSQRRDGTQIWHVVRLVPLVGVPEGLTLCAWLPPNGWTYRFVAAPDDAALCADCLRLLPTAELP